MARELYEICAEIRRDWKPRVSAYALPYLEAMETLPTVHHPYFYDSGESMVNYFLANAQSWKGDTARRVKAELKAMVGSR